MPVTPLGEWLRQRLAEIGMSKRQFAKLLAAERGITEESAKSSVAKWTRVDDPKQPRVENLLAIEKIVGLAPPSEDGPFARELMHIRRDLDEIRDFITHARRERHHEHEGLNEQIEAQAKILERQAKRLDTSARLLRELVEEAGLLRAEIHAAREAFGAQQRQQEGADRRNAGAA